MALNLGSDGYLSVTNEHRPPIKATKAQVTSTNPFDSSYKPLPPTLADVEEQNKKPSRRPPLSFSPDPDDRPTSNDENPHHSPVLPPRAQSGLLGLTPPASISAKDQKLKRTGFSSAQTQLPLIFPSDEHDISVPPHPPPSVI